jgi:O-antigen/teichoic acid export membrane protein
MDQPAANTDRRAQPISEARPPKRARRTRLSRVVASLTATNVAVAALGLVTGPILARSLGASGRGALAAILVPLNLAPWIFGLGLPIYAGKVAAQRRSLSVLVGSVGGMAIALGLVGAALAYPMARALAGDHHTVYVWLLVAFLILPLGVLSVVLQSIAVGLERWRIVVAARIGPPLLTLFGLLILLALGWLSVASAAAVTIGAGVIAASPLLPILRDAGRPRFRPTVAWEGLRFGAKAWLAQLANLLNYRLDQLLMIPLVEARQLGLYAVAVTLSGFGTALTSAVAYALVPAVARGDRLVPARALRITLSLIAAASVVVAVASPWLLPAVFGREFSDATTMTLILLLAGLPAAGIAVLTPSLSNAERPGVTAIGEAIALTITVPGLLVVLPSWGGNGAAAISLAAYTANFLFLLGVSARHFNTQVHDFVIPKREDVSFFTVLIRAHFGSWRRRSE